MQEGDRAGLRFRQGQQLSANTKSVPGLGDGKPFTMSITFTLEDKPTGAMSGLYQAMAYMQSGFRLVIGQNMKPNVELYYGPNQAKYLAGKTTLELGRTYELTMTFDGQQGRLYLDGKLDGVIDAPPPPAYNGDLMVGNAGGANYHLTGVIYNLKFYALGVGQNK